MIFEKESVLYGLKYLRIRSKFFPKMYSTLLPFYNLESTRGIVLKKNISSKDVLNMGEDGKLCHSVI